MGGDGFSAREPETQQEMDPAPSIAPPAAPHRSGGGGRAHARRAGTPQQLGGNCSGVARPIISSCSTTATRWPTVGSKTSAFDEAKEAVAKIVAEAAGRETNGQLTLLRFSEAVGLSAGAKPAMDRRPIDLGMTEELESKLGGLKASETDVGPLEALEAVARMPEPEGDETRILYLVSDFRERQWAEATRLRQLLAELRENVAQVHLVQCVEQTRPNLAITHLAPRIGHPRRRHRNLDAAHRGQLRRRARSGGHCGDRTGRAASCRRWRSTKSCPAKKPPAVSRRRSSNRGPTSFRRSSITTRVETDNTRYFACHLPPVFPVLIIDGSADGDDGYYLQAALSPGGKQIGGWSPEVQPASYLRRHDELKRFAAICLLDVPRLDASEIEALETYVRQGGGVAMCLGPQVGKRFYNEHFYRDGTGLLPVALGIPSQLLASGDPTIPDVAVSAHPLFRVFQGQRNSFLALAKVNFYFAADPQWKLPIDGNTKILAMLRNGAPFVVERQMGEGRVIVQLCKLSPKPTDLGIWSNWSLNPVFPVYANELVGYLSAFRRRDDVRTVGDGLALSLPQSDYEPEVRLRGPSLPESGSTALYLKPSGGRLTLETDLADQSGIWQLDLVTQDGREEKRLVAMNVPNGEGDLHHLDRTDLAKRLEGLDYHFTLASELTATEDQLAGYRLSDSLLYLLVGLLVAELLLAYSASYHNGNHRNEKS